MDMPGAKYNNPDAHHIHRQVSNPFGINSLTNEPTDAEPKLINIDYEYGE